VNDRARRGAGRGSRLGESRLKRERVDEEGTEKVIISTGIRSLGKFEERQLGG
jgi:hypothetical protein